MSERTIFMAAMEIGDATERSAYLDQACGDDIELRRSVNALLHSHEVAGSFLEGDAQAVAETIDVPPVTEEPGTIIGNYRLMEKIGEGGMGVVYVAQQQRPYRRKVALKIIKPGMDTQDVIARFEAERQALALMDHPNIAQVLDGGSTVGPVCRTGPEQKGVLSDSGPVRQPGPTAIGRPYFVMELVKGVPT